MSDRPRILDLFSGAGGAGMGYYLAGFDVVGVDVEQQQKYPFEFIRTNALALSNDFMQQFDAIHASPPCQASTALRTLFPDREYPELIPATRDLLVASGLPYVIENVPGALLNEPVVLCGSMFGLKAKGRQLRRHRLFECSFPVMRQSCQHKGQPIGVYGAGGTCNKRGFKGNVDESIEAMGIDWATRRELSQAIPPPYTEHIGHFLAAEIKSRVLVVA